MIIGIREVILNTAFVLLLDMIATQLIISDASSTVKGKWHKNERRIAYFHYPLYKKIFLMGLEGEVSRTKLVLTRIARIAVIPLLICSVLACGFRTEVISVLFLVFLCIEMLLNIARALMLIRPRYEYYRKNGRKH